MRVKKFIQYYFDFTKAERRGIYFLLVLIGLVVVADRLLFLFEKPGVADIKKFQELIASSEPDMLLSKNQTLFPFDPNTIDSAALDSLLLSEKIKRNILKYRSRGGSFRNAADFSRLYGMNDSIMDVLAAYLIFPKSNEHGFPATDRFDARARIVNPNAGKGNYGNGEDRIRNSRSSKFILDINQADSVQFRALPGIGGVLSKRIVKYRERLGGFYSVDQLLEVYGIKPDVLDAFKDRLTVNPEDVVLLDINFADVARLARHPYCPKEMAQRIVKFRSIHGFIENPDVLIDSMILSISEFDRIRNYFPNKK